MTDFKNKVLEHRKPSNGPETFDSYIQLNFMDLQYREAKGHLVYNNGIVGLGERDGHIICAYISPKDLDQKVKKWVKENEDQRNDYLFLLCQSKNHEVNLRRYIRTARITIKFTEDFYQRQKKLELKKISKPTT